MNTRVQGTGMMGNGKSGNKDFFLFKELQIYNLLPMEQ
jgi:hypothetical protein